MLITLQFCSPGYISTIYLRISALCSILHYIVYCIPLAWKDQQKKQHLRNMKPISRHPRHEAAAHDHKGCLRMEKHVGPEQLEALCSPLLLGKNQRKAGQTGDYYSWDAYYRKKKCWQRSRRCARCKRSQPMGLHLCNQAATEWERPADFLRQLRCNFDAETSSVSLSGGYSRC